MTADVTNKQRILKEVFGHDNFRDGQEMLIDAILDGRDVLGVMPTGAGKSVCYQVPALLKGGVTLVVSPLISLMKDQTTALVQNGVAAAYLNSSLTERQYELALRRAETGAYKIIYVAPERLNTASFQRFCAKAEISLLAVDEAHCVSQWGQDFRPSYAQIPVFLNALPHRPPVAAFTATATPRVREDVVGILNLRDPLVEVTGFDRKNLYFEVRKPKRKAEELLSLLAERRDKCGIVYCSTRKAVEAVTAKLIGAGFSATRYHAGLADAERRENQEDFIFDRKRIMVATNAFGMGIDKSNVAFVVHYNMPKDLESYYQEAGRAGRDGSAADCVLLYSGQDLVTARFLIEHKDAENYATPEAEAFLKEQERKRLKTMENYCKTDGCLRAYILEYFGEPRREACGHCGNCNSETEKTDVTVAARKILLCVAHCGERFGKQTIADVLRGSRAEKVLRCGLDRVEEYGACRESAAALRELMDYLLAENYLRQSEGEYPVLQKGPQWAEGVSTEVRIFIRRMRHREDGPERMPQFDAHSEALLTRLKALRYEIARQAGVPAYIIFNDSTLLEMSAAMPREPAALLNVSGVGKAKADRYGERFLSCIAKFLEEAEASVPAPEVSVASEDALSSFAVTEEAVTASMLADRLNMILLKTGEKKITAKTVNDWLAEQGLLDSAETAPGRHMRIVTAAGQTVGIRAERRRPPDRPAYDALLFGSDAQRYIKERLPELIGYARKDSLFARRKQ